MNVYTVMNEAMKVSCARLPDAGSQALTSKQDTGLFCGGDQGRIFKRTSFCKLYCRDTEESIFMNEE